MNINSENSQILKILIQTLIIPDKEKFHPFSLFESQFKNLRIFSFVQEKKLRQRETHEQNT